MDASIAAVRQGRYVEAIETDCAKDATMRENISPPRCGRDAWGSHERAVLAGLQAMKTAKVGEVLNDGD